MGLGSDSNFSLWVQKDASFYPTERRDSLAREKASPITPQKHHNKNNHHGLLLPSPSLLPAQWDKELARAQTTLVKSSPACPHERVTKGTCSRRKPPGTFKRAPSRGVQGGGEEARKMARSYWARLGRKTLRGAGSRRRLRQRRDGTRPAATLSPAPRAEAVRPAEHRLAVGSPARQLSVCSELFFFPGTSHLPVAPHPHFGSTATPKYGHPGLTPRSLARPPTGVAGDPKPALPAANASGPRSLPDVPSGTEGRDAG